MDDKTRAELMRAFEAQVSPLVKSILAVCEGQERRDALAAIMLALSRLLSALPPQARDEVMLTLQDLIQSFKSADKELH